MVLKYWLSLAILFTIEGPLSAAPLKLNNYLKTYIQQDETLDRAQLQLKSSESDYDIASDLWQTNLTVAPAQEHSVYEYSLLSDKTYDRSSMFVAQLRQGLSTGTELRLNVTSFPEVSALSDTYTERDYNIELIQDLWENLYGKLSGHKLKAAKHGVESAKRAYEAQGLKTCLDAEGRFRTAFLAQEKKRIFGEIFLASKKALKISERSYRRKLIRKIDILAARSDHLEIESAFESAKKEYEQSLITLLEPISEKKSSSTLLEDPSGFYLRPVPTEKNLIKGNKELLSINEKAEALSEQLRAVQREIKSTVQLSLQAGQKEGQTSVSSISMGFTDHYVKVSLEWEWPLFSKTEPAREAKAVYAKELALKEKQQKLEEIKAFEGFLEEEIQNLNSLIQISSKKMNLDKEQMKEANRLLSSGQIEFVDYKRYRDFYLNESLNQISLQSNLWERKSEQAALYGHTQWLCGGGL